MSISHQHRKKAKKGRNGRTSYEKGFGKYRFPKRRMFKGKRGSTTHAPELAPATLADVWPKNLDDG